MKFSLLQKMISGLTSLKPKSEVTTVNQSEIAYSDIHGNVIENGEYYFYRPKVLGFPVFKTENILEKHKDLIAKVHSYSGIGDHKTVNKNRLVDRLFTDVIANYVEYIHMLPASNNHHHSNPGGLIYHSLEASLIALREAKKSEAESSGFIDIDNRMKPVNHYAAWLLGLVHDSGKIFTDIAVYALTVIDKTSGKPVSATTAKHNIPLWHPQKESLIDWARRFGVVNYQVEFVHDRIHNRHNIASASIIDRILTPEAKDFILDGPKGRDLMAEFPRILASYKEQKDYLAQAVNTGDTLSTSKDRHVDFDIARGEIVKATDARIVDAMRIARSEWSFNKESAEVWIINQEVFLRWSTAFESILATAKSEDIKIPQNLSIITAIMRDRGIIEPLGSSKTACKYCPGEFSESDIIKIRQGKKNVKWLELVKLSWSGFLFGSSPIPNSKPGVIYLIDDDAYLVVDKSYSVTEYRFSQDGKLKSIDGEPVKAEEQEAIEAPEVKEQQADAKDSVEPKKKTGKKPKKQSAKSKLRSKKSASSSKDDLAVLLQPQDEASKSEKPSEGNSETSEQPSESSSETTEKPEAEHQVIPSFAMENPAGNSSNQVNSKAEETDTLTYSDLSVGAKLIVDAKAEVILRDDEFYVSAEQLTSALDEELPVVGKQLKDAGALKKRISSGSRLTIDLDSKKHFHLANKVAEEVIRFRDGEVAVTVMPEQDDDTAVQEKLKVNTETQETSVTPKEPVETAESAEPKQTEIEQEESGTEEAPATPAKPFEPPTSFPTTTADGINLAQRLKTARETTLAKLLDVVLTEGFPERHIGYSDGVIHIGIDRVTQFIQSEGIRQFRSVDMNRLLSSIGTARHAEFDVDYGIYTEDEQMHLWISLDLTFEVDLLNE